LFAPVTSAIRFSFAMQQRRATRDEGQLFAHA